MRENMHDGMVKKIEGLIHRIDTGYPLPGGNKMMDQDAEKELERIAKMYQKDLGYLPREVFDKLIGVFQKCLDLNFFWWEIKKEIKKAIKNLEKLREERSLENFEIAPKKLS